MTETQPEMEPAAPVPDAIAHERRLAVTVNGRRHEIKVDTRTTLVELLREHLRLTGAHIGCATGNCGACTVILDGRTVKSCSILAADVNGQQITTIEALSKGGHQLHPIQEAFVEHQGLQCGYCTPGMILSTLYLFESNPAPSEDEIRHALAGNLCRCTGYHFIVESVQAAAEKMQSESAEGRA
jgi:aerobic carbon-monoxide dehydrogenase small subunit